MIQIIGQAQASVQRTRGLTAGEAEAARLRLYGPNVLPPKRQRPMWWQCAAQVVHFFAFMLWVSRLVRSRRSGPGQLDPFAWFRDVLGRIADHPIRSLDQLLPHRWTQA